MAYLPGPLRDVLLKTGRVAWVRHCDLVTHRRRHRTTSLSLSDTVLEMLYTRAAKSLLLEHGTESGRPTSARRGPYTGALSDARLASRNLHASSSRSSLARRMRLLRAFWTNRSLHQKGGRVPTAINRAREPGEGWRATSSPGLALEPEQCNIQGRNKMSHTTKAASLTSRSSGAGLRGWRPTAAPGP